MRQHRRRRDRCESTNEVRSPKQVQPNRVAIVREMTRNRTSLRQCMAVNAITGVPHSALLMRIHGLTGCRLVWLNTWKVDIAPHCARWLTAEGAPTQFQGRFSG
jgi:hypothetical protein